MRFKHSGQIAAVVALIGLWSGCGDTFRPVAIPIPPTPPNPAPTHFVLSVSTNGTSFPAANNTDPNLVPNRGASTRIDVSGDSNAGVATLGLAPVHAAVLPNGNAVYVANSLDSTVSTYASTNPTRVTTISLGSGAKPVFVATAENTTVYVANAGTNTVGAITVSSNVMTQTVPLGFTPVALAETPDGKKVYAVGGNNGLVSINTSDKSTNAPVTDAGLNTPLWVVARADSQRVYVLNQGSGMLVTLDTGTDAVVGSDVSVGAGANFMFYDPARNRLYIVNPSSTRIVVLNAAADPPAVLAPIDLTAAVGATSPLCATGCIPTSVTALPDGSRVYIASYANTTVTDPVTQTPVPGTTTQITVFSTQTNTVKTLIPADTTSSTTAILAEVNTAVSSGCSTSATVPTTSAPSVRFRLFTAASPDGTRVYASNCDAGSTFIVDTSNDTLVPGQEVNPQQCTSLVTTPLTIPAPYSSFSPVVVPCVGMLPPRQNPVFVLVEQ